MENLLDFLVRSGIILTGLYVIYWVFLRKNPHSKVNRFYLISALIISFVFPLLPITFPGSQTTGIMYTLDPVLITPDELASGIRNGIMPGNILGLIYLAGSTFFLIRGMHQFLQIIVLIRKYGISRIGSGNVVVTEQDLSPFSIFNLVFLSRKTLFNPGLDQILEHEKAHIRQNHSLDLLLVELFVLVQWFNPVLWFYKRSLRSLHEYLADRSVLDSGRNVSDYQQLLLAQSFGVQFSPMSNFFNSSLIKNRFIMMTKEKNNRISKSTLFGIFPVALLLAFFLSASFTGPVTEGTAENGIESMAASNTLPQDDPVFSNVDQMPAFKGGYDALVNYLVKNIQYPEDARKNNVEGKVFTTFVIEKDGRVTGARILKSVDEQLDKEALRVVQEMPAWIPGKNNGKPVRVQFNLPIDFKLGDGKEQEKESSPSKTREGVKQYQKIKKDNESDGIH